MEKGIRHFLPKAGEVYQNRGGAKFRILSITEDGAVVLNELSGWMCTVHCITLYRNGSIEWDYSSGGRFLKPAEMERLK